VTRPLVSWKTFFACDLGKLNRAFEDGILPLIPSRALLIIGKKMLPASRHPNPFPVDRAEAKV
jgi:hypothetical protein